jgi:hypothetical protein
MMLVEGIGIIIFGVVLAGAGFYLLGKYRKLFFQNPRAVISLEIWSQVALETGGLGYWAMVFLFCGVWIAVTGVAVIGFTAYYTVTRI